jgi:hypothetical protein
MRTKVIWLLMGAAFGLLAGQALARTLTKSTAQQKAIDFAKTRVPPGNPRASLDSYGCRRNQVTLSTGERIDDAHRVFCRVALRRDPVNLTRCVEVTLAHRRNSLGQVSYPVSARFSGSSCPNLPSS